MRSSHIAVLVLASCAGIMAASGAAAETLYKLVAPDGKVTYTQEPPKDFAGKVIRLDIDTNANTAAGRRAAPGANEAIIRSNPDAARMKKLEEAQKKLEQARSAYEHARDNPGEGDVQRIGSKNGGARPVFSEEYQRKLDQLEGAMKQAEEEVDKLEHGR